MAVVVLYRPGGLTAADHQYSLRVSERFLGSNRPSEVVRVLGPASIPEIAQRLVSHDGTTALIAVSLSSSFVAPVTQDVVAWMSRQANSAELAVPAGLELRWTGDAVIGRDYMANVQTSLDRAAVATVVLLLIVLLAVYRSFWLALVPLATIGSQPGDLARRSGLDDPGRMGGFVAGRAFPDRDPVRHGHGFLPFLVLEIRRASESEQSGRLDAGDAGAFVLRAGDERRHDHHRPAADGDDASSSSSRARGRASRWGW